MGVPKNSNNSSDIVLPVYLLLTLSQFWCLFTKIRPFGVSIHLRLLVNKLFLPYFEFFFRPPSYPWPHKDVGRRLVRRHGPGCADQCDVTLRPNASGRDRILEACLWSSLGLVGTSHPSFRYPCTGRNLVFLEHRSIHIIHVGSWVLSEVTFIYIFNFTVCFDSYFMIA